MALCHALPQDRRTEMTAAALRAPAELALATEQEFAFSQKDFERVRQLIYAHAGIHLHDGKHAMVYSRLARRLRETGHRSFADYLAWLQSGDANAQAEWQQFVNGLTTNLTSFFREAHHFECLANDLRQLNRRDIRIWCSAASTGEEPYSIAISVAEAIPDWERWDIRILATDLDTNVLQTCVNGIYGEDRVRGMQKSRLERFFDVVSDGGSRKYRVKPELAKMVSFRQLNLMHPLPMKGPIDIIFCRNVIIYFDKDTQRALFGRVAPLQRPGDVLILGHSESLLQVSDAWTLMGKTIYRKNGP